MGIFKRWNAVHTRCAVLLVACMFAGLFALAGDQTSDAANVTLPTKMNFQGRVANSAGNILPNGTYNMKFRIMSAATGGTQLWSEDRLISASQGVTVTNGQFSVQLGSVTTLPASIFTSNSLYFEIELPTPATATTTSPSWTEGAMTPRNQLATSAYAYNAETLDGIDSDAFAQMGVSNTFTAAQNVNVSNANAFQVRNGSTNLFNVATSTNTVSIGTSDTTGAMLVLDTKTDAGDPTGANGGMYYNSNGGKFRCFENGAWKDCVTAPTTLQGAYDNDTSGVADIITTSATKGVLVRAGTGFDQATLFGVDDASGLSLFSVDSTNDRVYIGSSAADGVGSVLVLDTKNSTGDPTGVNGAMYYNSALAHFRCYENGAWSDCLTGYTINVQALSSSPTDAQTVYMGTLPRAPTTTAAISKIYIRKSGIIKAAEIYTYSATAGSNESWSIYIRKNNSADTLIATVATATNERTFNNSSLNLSVTAGDYIEIKGIQPTWGTNPVTTIYGGYLYIE